MDRDGARSKSRRKLNRTQITEILERNVQLYREEENFVHYLVDLAVYLLEYEYDWTESGGAPPQMSAPNGIARPGEQQPIENVNQTPPPADGAGKRPPGARISIESFTLNRRTCPYCGTIVGELVICPSCRNVTR